MIAVSVEKMRELENHAIEKLNVPSILLMENSAYGFVSALKAEIVDLCKKTVLVVCGKGNNAGDGYAIARILHFLGCKVYIHSVFDTSSLSKDAKTNCDIAKKAGIEFTEEFPLCDIIVDAVFGTGFHGDVPAGVEQVFELMNKSKAYIASVDIPSGLSADNGQGTKYVKSDLCVTFGYAKYGHFIFPGRSAYKKLTVVPISVGKCDDCYVITDKTFKKIPKRNQNSHKGIYGKALAYVGSFGMAGAAILSGSAILKSGTGMATVAVKDTIISSLAHHFPSVMTYPVPDVAGDDCARLILEKSKTMDALLIGCGLGMSDDAKTAVINIVKESKIPMVIDADGLNILSENIEVLKDKKAEVILTPHIAEFSRLSGRSVSEIKKNPIEAAKAFARAYDVTVILKDAVTVIADNSGNTAVCPVVNSGMATAGSGDVLAGIATGLLSQGMTPIDSAVLAVYIHSAAGKIAADEFGEHSMTSNDILNSISKAFMQGKSITPDIKEL